ncbi:hypothetical protein LAZ67_5002513 [Cordylochernes scorpioides]|uniref:Copia protein n=1 Tax=Cordylochernes scorpioides TaxID=51811 RepID=A0ABY6KGQ7_9ARAC|nr:hypothetical protein LAZ67_5002513 [Cordylochernes scorpioides]
MAEADNSQLPRSLQECHEPLQSNDHFTIERRFQEAIEAASSTSITIPTPDSASYSTMINHELNITAQSGKRGPYLENKATCNCLFRNEAEFIAAADACKEVSYIRSLLEELIPDNFDINLYIDNQSTIKIIKSGQFTTKTKHIDVKYHFVKDQVQRFNLIYCPTEHQIADILTKPLARLKFDKLKSLLMTTI